jgi:hypothetical protein
MFLPLLRGIFPGTFFFAEITRSSPSKRGEGIATFGVGKEWIDDLLLLLLGGGGLDWNFCPSSLSTIVFPNSIIFSKDLKYVKDSG